MPIHNAFTGKIEKRTPERIEPWQQTYTRCRLVSFHALRNGNVMVIVNKVFADAVDCSSSTYYALPVLRTGPPLRTLTQILVSHFHDFATQNQFYFKNNGFMLSSSSRHSIQKFVTID